MNKFLENICKDKQFTFAKDESADIYTIISNLTDNTLNISINENKISSYILKENNDIIEEFDKSYEDEEELNNIIDDTVNTFDIINQLDSGDTDVSILNEVEEGDEPSIFSVNTSAYLELDAISEDLHLAAEKIKSYADEMTNLDLKYIFTDISNNVESLVLDMQSALETYSDLENDIEPLNSSLNIEDVENSLTETQAKLKIAEGLLAARTLYGMKLLDKTKLETYEQYTNNLFKE